ncbi:MAG: molybdopterin-synthase adenylyltransferase MoeB [Oceanicoccus sp.]|uniref:HesA/MoeB/ThiF family protein n=1 Tax=Oceanicoccus sp. TaxID=2691044 RepID=UPI002606A81D|nr:HesA/MoeB/ThiF family protein [Oceanicoccus sp.]MCP3907612.1 molybdopterin-synthase adenylyltransferase MoeB [Oceanicoccus sp.]
MTAFDSQGEFSAAEWQRYQRHIQLGDFSVAGQRALKQSKVLIVGVGGLGCPAAQYLAAAGVGHLTLVDDDRISLSNLQRQILFTEQDIGQLKSTVAAARLLELNSAITIHAVEQPLTENNAGQLIACHDLVIDCTDNFHTRYLLNDLCHDNKKPWIYSSVLGFSGQLAMFVPGGACFRCLFPEVSEVPDCNQAGVLGVVPGMLGVLQALEAIKYIARLPGVIANQLAQVNALDFRFKTFNLKTSPGCLLCQGDAGPDNFRKDYQPVCSRPDAVDRGLGPAEFIARINQPGIRLIDVRSQVEHQAFNIGGEVIPVDDLIAAGLPSALDSDAQYLLYCQSGLRSSKAVSYMQSQGVDGVWSLSGGIAALLESSDDLQ